MVFPAALNPVLKVLTKPSRLAITAAVVGFTVVGVAVLIVWFLMLVEKVPVIVPAVIAALTFVMFPSTFD